MAAIGKGRTLVTLDCPYKGCRDWMNIPIDFVLDRVELNADGSQNAIGTMTPDYTYVYQHMVMHRKQGGLLRG